MLEPANPTISQPNSTEEIPQLNNPIEGKSIGKPSNEEIKKESTTENNVNPSNDQENQGSQYDGELSKSEQDHKSNQKPKTVYESILMKKSGYKKKTVSKNKKESEILKPIEVDEKTKEEVGMLTNLKNALFNMQTQAASYRLQQQKAQKENQTLRQQFEQMKLELQKSEKDRQKDSLYITKQEHEIAAHKLKIGFNDVEIESNSKPTKILIQNEESLKEEYAKKLSECCNYMNNTSFENVMNLLKGIEDEKEENVDEASAAMHILEALEQSISINANVTEIIKSVLIPKEATGEGKKEKLIDQYNAMKAERLVEQKKIAELEKRLEFIKEEKKYDGDDLIKSKDPMVSQLSEFRNE